MNIFNGRVLEMADKVREIDNSLNEFIERVRSAFTAQFGRRAEFMWVVDVFEDYVVVREDGGQTYKAPMEATDDGIKFSSEREWEKVKLSYVAELLPAQQTRDVLVVWELRGNFPDVPITEGVDYESLIAGDDDPVFLTLPIGKVNALSGNGRFYDEEFVVELERQTRETRPIGLMGHLKEEDRATAFPDEAIHWVGVRRVGEFLWGKGYVPSGPARDRIRRYKATGKKIATSIDALAKGVYDDTLKAYRMLADSMRLNQIDIAPADRAGIPALAAVPILTTEMNGDEPPQEKRMDKYQVIRELTAEDAKLLPEPVQEAVKSTVQPAPEVRLVTELRQALGVDEKADITAVITEMKTAQETQRKTAVSGRIKELVEDEETGVKIEAVRPLVTELITARNPQTVEEAEAAYKQVVEMDSVKKSLAAYVKGAMGPNQRTPLQALNGKSKYFDIPKEDKS